MKVSLSLVSLRDSAQAIETFRNRISFISPLVSFTATCEVAQRIDTDHRHQYRLGFQECMSECIRFLVDIDGRYANDDLCIRLMTHLKKHLDKLQGHNICYQVPGSGSSTPAPVRPSTVGTSSSAGNGNSSSSSSSTSGAQILQQASQQAPSIPIQVRTFPRTRINKRRVKRCSPPFNKGRPQFRHVPSRNLPWFMVPIQMRSSGMVHALVPCITASHAKSSRTRSRPVDGGPFTLSPPVGCASLGFLVL